MNAYKTSAAFTWPRFLNTLGLAGISATLLFAFVWQFMFNELPCPLCLLQRVALVMVGIGFLLNVRFGSAPSHYGLIILSALGGAVAAGRQTLLHMAPNDMGYGSPFLGLHFYTWAFIVFVLVIAACAVLLVIDRAQSMLSNSAMPNLFARLVMWLFVLLVIGNVVSTAVECGFGACPDNPTQYLWLKH